MIFEICLGKACDLLFFRVNSYVSFAEQDVQQISNADGIDLLAKAIYADSEDLESQLSALFANSEMR